MKSKRIILITCILALGLKGFFLFAQTGTNARQAKAGFEQTTGDSSTSRLYINGGNPDGEAFNDLPLQDTVTGHPTLSVQTRGASQRAGPPPKAYSLKKYAPIPGDQGSESSCSGWAAAYAAKTILESITLERTDRFLTTRNAYSPLYPYQKAREIDRVDDNTLGADMITVVSLMSEFGVPKNSEYLKSIAASNIMGSSRANTNQKTVTENFQKWTIKGIQRLFHNKDMSTAEDRITRIKTNISQGNPVIVGLLFPESSFEKAGEQWRPGKNERPDPRFGHAICVIGYDDDKFGGAFEVINSWGELWGNGGFTWIDYQTFDKFLSIAAVIIDDDSYYEKPIEWTGRITVFSENASGVLPVRLAEDGFFTPKTSLKTGTQLRFVLDGSNNRFIEGEIYPYVFYTDSKMQKTVQVWPPSGKAEQLTVERGKPLSVPANNQWIKTNDSVNAENFIFLFSRKELNITAIRSAFEKQKGPIAERLSAVLKNDLISFVNVQYEHTQLNAIADFLDTDAVMGMVLSVQYDKDGINPMDMIKISKGSFTMGSPKTDPYYDDDETQRKVEVNDFYIGDTAVTVGEFREFINATKYRTTAEKSGSSYVFVILSGEFEKKPAISWSNPSFSQEDNYPVVHVSWYDAAEYCNWRSRQEGLKPAYEISGDKVNIVRGANGYRLPTEAEWEYACRAGTTSSYNTGANTIYMPQANFGESYIGKPNPVKYYAPNKWGLYGMHGNVYEWTQDIYEGSDLITVRGGSWLDPGQNLRSAFRLPLKKDSSYPLLGFRLVRSAN